MILELSDSTNEDVLEVSNFEFILSMSHQTPSQMLDTSIQEISNVVECLKHLAFVDVIKNKLQHLNYDVIFKMIVQYLPSKFDGDIMFKLPPTKHSGGLASLM
jgi:hypothetical protein